jgi:hypothetical protein
MRFKAQEITAGVCLNGAYTALNTIILLEYLLKIKSKMIANFVKNNDTKPSKSVFRGLRFELVLSAKKYSISKGINRHFSLKSTLL